MRKKPLAFYEVSKFSVVPKLFSLAVSCSHTKNLLKPLLLLNDLVV